jgi:citrate synthase
MANGLDDVVVAETVLSEVDGLAGRLLIRGHSLDELAGGVQFEDVLAMLLEDFFDKVPDLPARLAAARREVFAETIHVDAGLLAISPLEAVRALTARLADGDDLATALRLVAAPAVFTPAVIRRRRGLEPVPPRLELGHAADMLAMLAGVEPDAALVQGLDAYLVTVSDHGLNASTFAARVVASTQAGLTSATVAAMSALKGPLHGGAPGPVLDMLDAIGTPGQAEPWLEAALDRGERLMGFGHRVYRVRDPRADALKAALRRLAAAGQVDSRRVLLAEAVEAAALAILRRRKPNRPLDTNVEFYTALLLEAQGFSRDAFTAVFAAGRSGGWIAHAREQATTGRLLRPQSVYVGPRPDQAA